MESDIQAHNRYSYALNNPLKYTDPSGEKIQWWGWMLMGMGLLDPMTASVTAATVGATVAATAVTVAGATYGTTVANVPIIGALGGIFTNYDGAGIIKNSFRITNGLFVTDKNKNFFGRIWEFTSRFTWEVLQTGAGYYYTQGRNIGNGVDRVDYFGGATFATKEDKGYRDGVSLGNFININISDEITGSFRDRVLSDPLFMHEYGHTIDSRVFGLSYLFAIGIPSIISASKSSQIDGEFLGVHTHDFFWTEMRANKRAKKYFGKYYGIDWDSLYHIWGENYLYLGTTIEIFYPTIKR